MLIQARNMTMTHPTSTERQVALMSLASSCYSESRSVRRTNIARLATVALTVLLGLAIDLLSTRPAYAYENYQVGHITRVSYVTSGILIMIDNAVPTNCTGTPYGWLMISSSSTSMMAFVTGLWMRGDAAQVSVTIYTGGIDSTTGYCQVGQIDTGTAG
jgi:hypothetical protein